MTQHPLPSAGQRNAAWGFVALQFGLLAGIVLAPRGTAWSVTTALQVAGWSLIGLGIALGLWAAVFLGRGLTPLPLPNGAVGLVTGGPYRWVRHPMYTAVMLVTAGVAARSGSWLIVTLTALLMALFRVKSAWEEQRLIEALPGYGDYRARVPRFLPRARPRP